MGFLDGVEKLINEHGSAVILKERIALANDKYAALEMRATTIEKENVSLKAEITDLKAENVSLKVDNEQLTIQIKNLNKPTDSHDNPLEDVKVKLLYSLSTQQHLTLSEGVRSR